MIGHTSSNVNARYSAICIGSQRIRCQEEQSLGILDTRFQWLLEHNSRIVSV